MPPDVFQHAQHRDDRGWEDRLVRLVVEADVPADDRDPQRLAGTRDPQDGFSKRPEHLRALGAGEVEAIRDGGRHRPDARDVLGGLEHGQHPADVGVEVAAPTVAVDRERQPDRRSLFEAEDARVRPRRDYGVGLDHVVVLPEHPPLVRDIGRGQQGHERRLRRGDREGRGIDPPDLLEVGRLTRGRGVGGRFGEALGIQGDHDRAAVADGQQRGRHHAADHDGLEAPPAADPEHVLLAAALDDQQHPLLRLAEEHLVRRHPFLAAGDLREVDLHPHPAAGRHLTQAAGQPRGAHVLDRHHGPGGERFEARLDEELPSKGVAHLHRGAVPGVAGQFRGGERRSVDPVAPGARAEVDDRVPRAGGAGGRQPVRARDPETGHVHERVGPVARGVHELAADRGHPDAVPVGGDPGDHPPHQGRDPGVLGRAEPEGVEQGDRARSHRQDVADDPADPRRGPVERRDRARVVVALHLEDGRPPGSDHDRAGVFPRPLQHPAAADRESREHSLRVLVRAVLAPHHPEHRQFGPVGDAAEAAADLVVLRGPEPGPGKEVGHRKRLHRFTRPPRPRRPRPGRRPGTPRR